jgi:hypothetical protein
MKPVRIALLAAAFALAACSDNSGRKTGAGTAEGEILPGAASDAMLPLDTARSEAPLAPKSEGSDKPDRKTSSAPKAASEAPAKAEPAPEPAPAASEEDS